MRIINDSSVITTPDMARSLQRQKRETEKVEISELITNNGSGSSLSSYDDPSKVIGTEIALKQTESYIKSSTKMSQKLSSVSNIISKTHDLMTNFKKDLMNIRTSKEIPNNNFATTLNRTLTQLEEILKSPVMGGTTELYNDQSVDFSLLTNIPTDSTPDYSYCLGCETGTNLHIDGTNMVWDISSITAKDPMFEQFIRSIRLAQLGNPSDPTDAYFKKAMDLLDQAELSANSALESTKELQNMIDEKISIMTDENEKRQELYESIAVKSVPELIMIQSIIDNDLEAIYSIHVRELQTLQMISQMNQKLI